METKLILQCLVLSFCSTERSLEEIPKFVDIMASAGALLGRPIPRFNETRPQLEEIIQELRKSGALANYKGNPYWVLVGGVGKSPSRAQQRSVLREYGIDLKKIPALADALESAFNTSGGRLLSPPNPFMEGLQKALQLR